MVTAMAMRPSFAFAALVVAGGAFLYACSEDETHPKPPVVVDDCTIEPGQIPAGTCGSLSCKATTTCSVDQTKCGSTSTCLPMGDNNGKQVLDFRIRRLNVLAPTALASK